jgi:hypothetical protein
MARQTTLTRGEGIMKGGVMKTKFRKWVETELDLLRTKIDQHCNNRIIQQSVTCEICGCLVDLAAAIKGKSEIRIRKKIISEYYLSTYSIDEEYIFIPFYCKLHAPKVTEAEK